MKVFLQFRLFDSIKTKCVKNLKTRPVACTINIYDRRFYNRNDIGKYYNTLEMIVIDDLSLS